MHNNTNKCFVDNNVEAHQHITNDTPAEFDSGDDNLTSDEDINVSDYDTPHFDEDRDTPAVTCAVNESNINFDSKRFTKIFSTLFVWHKERYKFTQVAIQGIIQGTASITQQCIAALKPKV